MNSSSNISFQLRMAIRKASDWAKADDSIKTFRMIRPRPFKRRELERAMSVLHSGAIRRTVVGEKPPKVESERQKGERKLSVSGSGSGRASVSR